MSDTIIKCADTIIKCFFCKASIAVVDEHGDGGPTLTGLKLHVIGGAAIYCCLKCGAVQILERETS